MLQNDFYTIILINKEEINTISAKIILNPDHAIFKGHFPEKPVVPGVCLNNMIVDTFSENQSASYFLKSADQIKYLAIVDPGVHTEIFVTIRIIEQNENSVRIDATIFSGELIFMKFKGRLDLI